MANLVKSSATCPMNEQEQWRPIPGFEGFYEASSEGQIRSLDRTRRGRGNGICQMKGRVLAPRIDPKSGRHRVYLSVKSEKQEFKVATLVALAFIGPRPEGLEVCHRSDDKDDNTARNLYYGTHQENCDDRSRNGKTMRGEKATGVKLTEAQVREIKAVLAAPRAPPHRALADQYGVARETIGHISLGKTWAHVRI